MKNARILALSVVAGFAVQSQAALYFNDNFATFNNGDLVGQNGWAQLGTATASPIQVSGGRVIIPGGQTTDTQDAWRSLGTQVVAPGSGTTPVFVGMTLTVDAATPAGKSPSYFFGMSTNQLDATGFVNMRMSTTNDLASGANNFRLMGRVTGQSGAPWSLGNILTQGVQYKILIEADQVAGAQNDLLKIYVNPTSGDLSTQTPDLVASLTSGGNGTDPTGLGTVILSQFGSSTTTTTGLSINQIAAGNNAADVVAALSAIPEPSVLSIGGIGLLLALVRRNRK